MLKVQMFWQIVCDAIEIEINLNLCKSENMCDAFMTGLGAFGWRSTADVTYSVGNYQELERSFKISYVLIPKWIKLFEHAIWVFTSFGIFKETFKAIWFVKLRWKYICTYAYLAKVKSVESVCQL